MNQFPKELENFIKNFSRLPGIGEKTAYRLMFNLLRWKKDELSELSKSIEALSFVHYCQECGNFSEINLCSLCQDEHRKDFKSLCVVENITDLWAIEKSGEFKGIYHVLGGVLNPLLGIGPDKLSIKKLQARIEKHSIAHVILALNPSVEGEATCSYLKEIFPKNLEIQRIGFGIPVGGSLEFLDSRTIAQALENRKNL